MNLSDKVFKVSGTKVESLVIKQDSLMFLNKGYKTVGDFTHALNKTFNLVWKKKIKLNSIKSVIMKDSDQSISINFKGFMNLPKKCTFMFFNKSDNGLFFDFLQNDLNFKKVEKRLTPLESSLSEILFVIIGISLIFLAYILPEGSFEWKGLNDIDPYMLIIKYGLHLLGNRGLMIFSVLLTCLFGYFTWKAIKNPPTIIRFLPQ